MTVEVGELYEMANLGSGQWCWKYCILIDESIAISFHRLLSDQDAAINMHFCVDHFQRYVNTGDIKKVER